MPTTILSEWGERIEARRRAAGWSQDELARRAGIEKSTLWRRLRAEDLTPAQRLPIEAALTGLTFSGASPGVSHLATALSAGGLLAQGVERTQLAGNWPRLVEMIADAVGRALRRVVLKEELGGSRNGKTALISILTSLQSDLQLRGYNADDIVAAIEYVRREIPDIEPLDLGSAAAGA